jgi:primosomal protein N' (replication factor Y)
MWIRRWTVLWANRVMGAAKSEQRELFDRDPAPWELDAQKERCVATVVFAGAVEGEYDYRVPDRLRADVSVGKRLQVPFGRGNRRQVGYCVAVRVETEGARRLKDVARVMDATPLLSPPILQLSQWLADYYLAPWGRVLETVLPAGVREQAGTRNEIVLRLAPGIHGQVDPQSLPPKQAAVVQLLVRASGPIPRQSVMQQLGCTASPIQALEKKGVLRCETRRVLSGTPRQPLVESPESVELHADQQRAVDGVIRAMEAGVHETVLLHGVTGSGKTEVYIRAIEEVMRYGRQAIVLVPEISLTPQTERRFRARFPQVAVLHSHLSDSERHWHWRRIERGEIQVVVGARSAVFAPTPHLGLIVLDEEHDGSFKQDSIPRYHARDVARFRAAAERVPLILGSATPSLESWQQAASGSFRLVSMPQRILDRPMPEVVVVDLRHEFGARGSRGAIGRRLEQAIRETLERKEQTILLLNRRGFSTHIQCPACGEVVRCPDCDLALTHHREGEKALCHYCDYEILAPRNCPECGFEGIRYSGLGTQRLEAEVRERFPRASSLRMDSDSMRRAGSYEECLSRFHRGEVQILLGTQMIAKGLDFPNVTLVGVINADTALHLPDFRAAERTFQLVTQVAGRTGRGEKGGRVLVQTLSPDHPAIRAAERHDYEAFAREELPHRAQFGYPPFGAMIRVIVRGEEAQQSEQAADQLARMLRAQLAGSDSVRVLGAAPAPMPRLRGKFRFHLILQGPNLDNLRAAIRDVQQAIRLPDTVQWTADVDPWDML